MSDSIARDRDEFLRRIAEGLPFEPAEASDIVRELEAHLADSAAALAAQGLSPEEAERTAIERLGPPERLADSLTAARRSPRRALAAAGAGTYAAAGGIVYGYVFALLVVLGVSIATLAMSQGPLRWFGGGWSGWPDGTTVTVGALWVAAYVAGHKLTSTLAARAGYRIGTARPIATVVGGPTVLAFALFGWRGGLNALEVVMLLALPVWFVAGAWRATTAVFPSRGWRLKVIGLAVVGIPVVLLLGMGYSGSGSGGDTFRPQGVDRIGLPLPAATRAALGEPGGSGSPAITDEATMSITANEPAALAGWSDLRIEAWRGIRTSADYPGDWIVDPAATRPFATAPAKIETVGSEPDGLTLLRGSAAIDRNPDVTLAWIAITGIAPDGQRYLIDGLSFSIMRFNGTVADWLTAVLSDR